MPAICFSYNVIKAHMIRELTLVSVIMDVLLGLCVCLHSPDSLEIKTLLKKFLNKALNLKPVNFCFTAKKEKLLLSW